MLLKKNDIHLWRLLIPELVDQENQYIQLLNEDELERANRFRFLEHRQRFIIVRAVLRSILSLYTKISPKEIVFSYGPHGKPYLLNHPIYFNVSHSHDIAMFAFTKDSEIGVDIEKIKTFHQAVAKRFFNHREYTELMSLSEKDRDIAFYRLWACKEALLKLTGEGLFQSLSHFNVFLHKKKQWIIEAKGHDIKKYYLEMIDLQHDYAAAFATHQNVESIFYYEWSKMDSYDNKEGS